MTLFNGRRTTEFVSGCSYWTCILALIWGSSMFREARRSTRVPLKVAIEIEGSESVRCDGETVVVNLQGALISTPLRLSIGMRIMLHVYMTDKHAKARVVYVDPENALRCGVELDQPRNIWGVPLPPEDWDENAEVPTTR